MEIAGGILTGMATNATMFAVWAGALFYEEFQHINTGIHETRQRVPYLLADQGCRVISLVPVQSPLRVVQLRCFGDYAANRGALFHLSSSGPMLDEYFAPN